MDKAGELFSVNQPQEAPPTSRCSCIGTQQDTECGDSHCSNACSLWQRSSIALSMLYSQILGPQVRTHQQGHQAVALCSRSSCQFCSGGQTAAELWPTAYSPLPLAECYEECMTSIGVI